MNCNVHKNKGLNVIGIIPMGIVLWVFFVFLPVRSGSQNLVPNSSFELYSSCPVTNYGEIYKLDNWYDFVISADYYNCSAGVPSNNFGYQYANTGSGYIGFGHGERVAVKLLQKLEAGKNYHVELFVSPGNYLNYISDVNVFFSEDSLCELSTRYRAVRLTNGSAITDTLNWTKLSADFIAAGCEHFLGLDIPDITFVYYYFDDISLECIDTSGCNPPACVQVYNEIIPNIFTPNKDGWNDDFRIRVFNSEPAGFNCTIYNRWGQIVRQIGYPLSSWDGKDNNGDDVPDGVYYFFLNFSATECGEWYSRNGYVHLMR